MAVTRPFKSAIRIQNGHAGGGNWNLLRASQGSWGEGVLGPNGLRWTEPTRLVGRYLGSVLVEAHPVKSHYFLFHAGVRSFESSYQ